MILANFCGLMVCAACIARAGIPAANITLIDQSPHQLAKAKEKPALRGAKILEVILVLP